jgi:hypothetical protein
MHYEVAAFRGANQATSAILKILLGLRKVM